MADSAVVVLNVGGQLFTTTAATLGSPLADGSMLSTMLQLHQQRQEAAAQQAQSTDSSSSSSSSSGSGMQPTLIDPRHPGALFIDRDGSHFSYILNYLREGGAVVLPPDLHSTRLLLREAAYYQLKGLRMLLTRQMDRHDAKLAKEADDAESDRTRLQEQLGRATQLLASVKQSLQDSQESLSDLRKYLAPDCLYHRGKRGGPNFRKPRQLLEDIQEMLPDSEAE